MNIDFTDAFEQGMSEQEALEMVQRICREEQEKAEATIKAQAAAHRAKNQVKKTQKTEGEKEALKVEARAHTINALLAYIEAFDLLSEDEAMDDEDVAELEQLLIKIENMIPVYFKLFKMQEDMNEEFGFGLGGLFK